MFTLPHDRFLGDTGNANGRPHRHKYTFTNRNGRSHHHTQPNTTAHTDTHARLACAHSDADKHATANGNGRTHHHTQPIATNRKGDTVANGRPHHKISIPLPGAPLVAYNWRSTPTLALCHPKPMTNYVMPHRQSRV